MEAVEIQVERGSKVSPLDLTNPDEVRVEVAFVDPVVATTSPDHPELDLDGWEIGALVVLLSSGATTVTGVDQRRVARVRAVLAALEAAR